MYEHSDIADMVGLIGNGLLSLHVGNVNGEYPLEQWKEAWDEAAETAGFANLTVIKP